MTTLPNMSLVLPTVGGSSGTWGTTINSLLALIDAHDHAPGRGVLVPSSGIGINANLSFAGYSIANLAQAAFTTSAASGSRALFVSDGTGGLTANELYWRTSAGASVRLTSGTSLNVNAFVGGIGGDYSAVSAALNYDSATTAYTHKGASGTNWALLRSGEIRVYESGTSETFYVGQAAPAALASSYTATWPAALPGSTAIVQISSAGVMSFSNTIANAVTMSSTLGVTGLITATAGLTAAANQHVTVSGTGEFKHGDLVLTIPGCSGRAASGISYSTVNGGVSTTASTTIFFNVPLKQGDRLKSVTFSTSGDGAVDFTAIDFLISNTSTDVTTLIGSTTITNVGTLADTTINLTDTTLTANESAFMYFTANAANAVIRNVRVTYDRP